MSELEIRRPGLAMVQDLGRLGFGRFGVSPCGVMDPLALRAANRLLGNPEGAAALEITGPGCEVSFTGDALFVIAGADLGAVLDGHPISPWRVQRARTGAALALERRVQGARAVLAVAGGIAAPLCFGSAAADRSAGIGGADGSGRGLVRGQRLQLGALPGGPVASHSTDLGGLLKSYADPFVLRFVPDEDDLPADTRARFASTSFRLSPRSSRMGYRLEGGNLTAPSQPDRLSEPLCDGVIQLPPDGVPILLMADRNTAGGYPRLGHLIAADRPKAAQLWPGDPMRFLPVTLEVARAEARAQESALEMVEAAPAHE